MKKCWFNIMRWLLVWLLSSCWGAAIAGNEFRVVVSIKPVHSLMAALMAGTEGPELIVDGSSMPFDYRLQEAQLAMLNDANLLIWVGPELESFLAAPVSGLDTDVRVVELLSHPALKVLPSRWDENKRDPFLWLDTRNAVILVDELTRILIDLDPGRSHLYLRNRRSVQARVSELDRRFEYGYRGLQQGSALVYHDTLQYFSQAYALRLGDVLTPLGERPKDVERLFKSRALLDSEGLGCVLMEEGADTTYLPLLTEGIDDVSVGRLDSLGRKLQPGPELYRQLMEYNAEVIRRCLGGGSESSASFAEEGLLESALTPLGSSFLLTDHRGKLVSEKAFIGNYNLVYFGYTYCPDVCPTSLQVMSLALSRLGDQAKFFQPWFITIDPKRDNVEKINRYVKYFNENLIGLTGSAEMIERVASRYRVKYQKVEDGVDPDLYIMDHTASLFLIGPDGQFITKFAYGITPDALIDRLREYL